MYAVCPTIHSDGIQQVYDDLAAKFEEVFSLTVDGAAFASAAYEEFDSGCMGA